MIRQMILLELECYFDFCFILIYPTTGVIENGTKEKYTIRILHLSHDGGDYQPGASNSGGNHPVQ